MPFPCRRLRITNEASNITLGENLSAGYSPSAGVIIYYATNASRLYKIQYPFKEVIAVSLGLTGEDTTLFAGGPEEALVVRLSQGANVFIYQTLIERFMPVDTPSFDEVSLFSLTHSLYGSVSDFRPHLAALASLGIFTHDLAADELNYEYAELPRKENEACTDSGYASVSSTNRLDVRKDGDESGNEPNSEPHAGESEKDEAKTEYSAATTIPQLAHESIAWVCDDIYSSLHNVVDPLGYQVLSNGLPRLLKAFAIKLGGDASNVLNGRVMRFVHKHHGRVILFKGLPG